MIERHGSLLLFLAAIGLLAAGIATGQATTRIGLCALGAGLLVLAVVLSRTEGALKIGPGGLEAQLRSAQQAAVVVSRDLSQALDARGLDLLSLATGQKSLSDAPHSEAEALHLELLALLDRVREIDAAQGSDRDPVPPEALLEAARGLMASHQWKEAARYLDRYVALVPGDWEAHYARAVAYANARGGPAWDLAALRAYGDVIALAGNEVEPNMLARLLTYRGAMLKRLDRLVEAEADFNAADGLAVAPTERSDVDYNLACVYAMTGRREEALTKIRGLRGTQYIDAIRAHVDRYFASLAADPEFRAAVGLSG
jgi:tetratricopeptide (TPR) repeat protein